MDFISNRFSVVFDSDFLSVTKSFHVGYGCAKSHSSPPPVLQIGCNTLGHSVWGSPWSHTVISAFFSRLRVPKTVLNTVGV